MTSPLASWALLFFLLIPSLAHSICHVSRVSVVCRLPWGYKDEHSKFRSTRVLQPTMRGELGTQPCSPNPNMHGLLGIIFKAWKETFQPHLSWCIWTIISLSDLLSSLQVPSFWRQWRRRRQGSFFCLSSPGEKDLSINNSWYLISAYYTWGTVLSMLCASFL